MTDDVRARVMRRDPGSPDGPTGTREADAEERLRLALDTAMLGVWSVEVAGQTAELSAACRALYDLGDRSLTTLAEFLACAHQDDRALVRAAIDRAVAPSGDGVLAIEHRVIRPDGTVRWLRARGQAAFVGHGAARRAVSCSGIVQDVTDEVTRAEDGRFVITLGVLVPTISDPDEILTTALARLVDYLGVAHALVTEIDIERGSLMIRAHASRIPGASHVGEYDLWAFSNPSRLADVGAGRPLVVDDAEHDPRTKEQFPRAYGPLGYRSYVTVPQMRAGKFVGGVSIADAAPRAWTAREVELLRQVAERAWPAYESARLLRAEQDASAERGRLLAAAREAELNAASTAERVERLQHVTAQLSRVASVGDVCEALVTVGREALGADAGLIVLVDDAHGVLRIERAFQYHDHLLERWTTIPIDTSVPVAESVRTQSPVWLPSRHEGSLRFPVLADDLGEHGHHAWAALPLVVESRAIGAIGVSFHEAREFADDYRSFALAMAQLCGQALERARLYEAERRARAEAEEARLRAESANRTKSDFLAVMSHELRTPLNAIGGYAQLLQMGLRGPVTLEQKEDLARIERSQHTLLGLINDVLSFAKLESGHIDYVITRVSLTELLATLETLVRPQVTERRLAYRSEVPAEGLAARADRDRTLQILLNLATNAVKFTPPHGAVSVRAERRGAEVAIVVRDTGRGVPREKLEVIFQPFVQVDARLTRESGGIGLGLAISRDLAQAMGGDLTVSSIEGEGATFTLTLPVG